MRKIKLKWFIRKIILLIGFLLFMFVLYKALLKEKKNDRKFKLLKIDELVNKQSNHKGCKQPKLPLHSSEILKFMHKTAPINCSMAGFDWFKCKGFKCRIQDQIKLIYGPIKCAFTDIIRVDDSTVKDGKTTYSDSYYKLQDSDVVRVSCTSRKQKWSAILTGIRESPDIQERTSWESLPTTAVKLNVLMLGFASLSRNTFIHKLPKTFNFLANILQGDILKGYNIVGESTSQALIPILTGQTELELPDTRKRFPNTEYVDSYPFIWNDFKRAGYVTAFLEDLPELGAFTKRLNGFNETPTDHYMRPYYFASFPERKKWPKLCTGETPRHNIMLNQIKYFFSVYKTKPKFMFAFHGELSHNDFNLIGAVDDDLYNLLAHLNMSGALDTTILVLMSDRGNRFSDIHNSIEGKQEERLPFFSFAFPNYFKTNYRISYNNFQWNIDRLTTPFDIYKTLKSLLWLDSAGEVDISERSASLLSEIPMERSCADAYIEPHWCTCLEWRPFPVDEPIVEEVGETVLEAFNNHTEPFRDICQIIDILYIQWMHQISPNEQLIKYKKNVDLDGLVPDFSAKMTIKTNVYQISFVSKPGGMIFEAIATHFIDDNRIEVNISDIVRINMIGAEAQCVENDFTFLRSYCYCVDSYYYYDEFIRNYL